MESMCLTYCRVYGFQGEKKERIKRRGSPSKGKSIPSEQWKWEKGRAIESDRECSKHEKKG
jgi:hypothetical protein